VRDLDNGETEREKLPSYFAPNYNLDIRFQKPTLLGKNSKFNEMSEIQSSSLRTPFKFKIIGFEQLWTVFDMLLYNDKEKIEQDMERNNYTHQPQYFKPNMGDTELRIPELLKRSIVKSLNQSNTE